MGAIKRIKKWFNPSFGTGAPGGSVDITQPYYDTSTSPYTPYVFNSGSWVIAATEPLSATSLQGTAVSATAPSVNGQQLVYNGTNYAPT